MKEMHRREFLRKLLRTTPVAAGAAAIAAAALSLGMDISAIL